MVIRSLGRALRGGAVGSRMLTFVDQGMSSASNLLLSISIASGVSASAFGEFALLYSVYWLLLGGTRAAVLDPLLITQRNVLRNAPISLIAALSALTVGAVGIPIGLALIPTPLDRAWIVFLLGLPVLLLQDALRYVGFLRGQPGRAVLLDGVWLLVMVGATFLAVTGTISGTAAVLGCWVLGALVASLVGLVALPVRAERPRLRARLRSVWPVSGPLVGDFALSSGAAQVVVFVLPLVANTALLGSLKAAQVANGPLNITVAAATVICLPVVAGAVDHGSGPAAALRVGRLASATLAGIAVLYGSVLVLLPDTVGRALFGQSWGSGLLVAAVSVQATMFGITHGALLVLRGSRNTRPALWVRIAVTPLSVVLPVVLTAVWGETGLVAGLLVGAAAMSVISWVVAVRVVRSAPGRQEGTGAHDRATSGRTRSDAAAPSTH
jgi:O-antigen/teichoic acid export membrane protein